MSWNSEIDTKLTTDHDIDLSYIRFDPQSTLSTCSSIVLSSCSSDEENDDQHATPPLRWKRQKILNNDYHNTGLNERQPSGNSAVNNVNSDRNVIMSAKENVATTLDEERRTIPPRRLPPIPEDKLHRRNPHTVRQEIKMFDDVIPDTNLADVHLSEMPGLHNTEQWKRIAGRAVHASPPLSRQYYQTVISTIDLQNGQVPQPLGSYRRPGRSENEQHQPTTPASPWRAPRRRIFFGSSVAVVVVAIVVAVVLAITLVQKTGPATTDFYSGSISVNAKFDQVLFDPSSSLARSYKRDFCTLIGTTLADTKTRYALYYSTCSVTGFRNGSIIADFVLGFTHSQNVTRLSSFLNRTLINKQLFGGTIFSVTLNPTILSHSNNTNSTDPDYSSSYENEESGDESGENEVESTNSGKLIMTDQNLVNDQVEPTRTTYTAVSYTKLDTGLSITISETITITTTNNNTNTLEKSSITNKNYELILVPSADDTKTIVVPTGDRNEKSLLSPAVTTTPSPLSPPPPPPPTTAATTTTTTTTTNVLTKSPSHQHLLQPIKSVRDSNFAYIDESSDDRTFSSGDATSTLDDLTTHVSTTSSSTISLNDEAVLKSNSTLVNNSTQSTKETPTRPISNNRRPPPPPPPPLPNKNRNDDSTSKEQRSYPLRPNVNANRRRRRMVISKNQRRLLQYELMPTGKVYYVDRPFYNENKNFKDDTDENSSVMLSTILSRSSSLDTLSDKRYRYRHHHHQQQQQQQQRQQKQQQQPQQQQQQQQQQQNRRLYQDLTLKKPEQKVSIGGRLASNNNLPLSSSPFKPINGNKKKRFSSFEPTPESLDRVFDVLIAADKRREEHEFWKEKFDQRQPSTRIPIGTGRVHDATNSNTIPFIRSKQTQVTSNSTIKPTDNRSQSYTTNRNSFYESNHQQGGNLLEDCLRKRRLLLQQQQQQAQRNYSPNIIYSTNYPKQQLPVTSKPPLPTPTTTTTAATTTTANQQPIRILPMSNGRIGRAPQARQTSDELSSVSDVWATRSSLEDEYHHHHHHHPKKLSNHARFQSTVNRQRYNEQKFLPNKRASSVEQQKSNRVPTKNSATTKNKFFDLFKFTR